MDMRLILYSGLTAVLALSVVSPVASDDLLNDDFLDGEEALGGISIDKLSDDVRPDKIIPPKVLRPIPAEPPLWPVGVPFPGQTQPPPGRKRAPDPTVADAYAWVPGNMKHIRATLLLSPDYAGRLLGQHPALRELAAKREVGILYLKNFEVNRDRGRIASILDMAARYTKVKEFKHAPWIVCYVAENPEFGIDLAGRYPARTVAGIALHAPAPACEPQCQ